MYSKLLTLLLGKIKSVYQFIKTVFLKKARIMVLNNKSDGGSINVLCEYEKTNV